MLAKLRERQLKWQSNPEYNQDAMPEVYRYYTEFLETGNYPYT